MKTKSTPTGSIDHPVDPLAFALGSGASFVARCIDVDAPHLQEVLRRAHAHPGTAFVEILQNCPVFNDGAWEDVQDRKTRADSSINMTQGEPLVFGSPGRRRGIALEGGVPALVDLADDDDPVEKGVVVHDEFYETTAYGFALATLREPDFPLPVGVFREVQKACYEDMLTQQVVDAIAHKGDGDLHALLHSGDTWKVDA